MDIDTIQQNLLSILTSIITGGFVLVFVEIGNRKNREQDRYYQIMGPFMAKFTAYLRLISWCKSEIIFPKDLNEYEKAFKKILNRLSNYGGRAIVSGGNYAVERFNANDLSFITEDINNVWYWYDKMHPSRLIWDSRDFNANYIEKELEEINPVYLRESHSPGLVAKVSGDFYTDIYQPIESETYRHESYMQIYKKHTIFVAVSILMVMVYLVSMLFVEMPVWSVRFMGIIVMILLFLCMLLLAVDVKNQIKLCNTILHTLTKSKHTQ
jgi:uncharacterized membrane protein